MVFRQVNSAVQVPIIFLPGLLCDEALFSAQTQALSAVGHTCITLPLLGADTIFGLADMVMAAAPPHFHLVGLSTGGYVAQHLLRVAPHRIAKLALLNTSARADDAAQRMKREGLIKLAELGRFKGVTPRLLPSLLSAENLTRPEVTQVILDMAARIGRENFIAQQRAIISREDSRAFLPTVKHDVLLIAGTDDLITPPAVMQEMAALLANNYYHELPSCGHLSALEQATHVNDLLFNFFC